MRCPCSLQGSVHYGSVGLFYTNNATLIPTLHSISIPVLIIRLLTGFMCFLRSMICQSNPLILPRSSQVCALSEYDLFPCSYSDKSCFWKLCFVSRPVPVWPDLWQLEPSRTPVCSQHTPSLVLRSERQHVGRHRLRRPVATLRGAQEEDLSASGSQKIVLTRMIQCFHTLRSSGGGVI